MIAGNFYLQSTHGWHLYRLYDLVYIFEILSELHLVSYCMFIKDRRQVIFVDMISPRSVSVKSVEAKTLLKY